MADRMIHIAWGAPVAGNEERAFSTLNEAIGLAGRMQQDGRIESFDVALMVPNPNMNGYVTLRGSAEQLDAVRRDEEFRSVIFAAKAAVYALRVYPGYTEQGVAQQLAKYQTVAAVAQPV